MIAVVVLWALKKKGTAVMGNTSGNIGKARSFLNGPEKYRFISEKLTFADSPNYNDLMTVGPKLELDYIF